ncbi:MAG TPA: efflux RND transporter permease subunit [Pseudonocardiaceae bacterium]
MSVHFRILIIGVAAAVLGLGIVRIPSSSLDVLPEFTPTQVQIQSEALGLSAAEVEQLVTVPLEQDLLNGVAWLDQIHSSSTPGLSSIDLVFQPGTDILKARQAVQERLTQAYALPAVGSPPVMIQPLSSTARVTMIGLSAKDLPLIDMSILARWKIKPKLMGIPGVANVAIWGQRDRQLQVQVDSTRLRQYGLNLNQVLTTTGNALWVSSLSFVEASTPGTGGFIDTTTQRLGIQHVLPITTSQDLATVTVEDTPGRTLRLGQVANVVEDHQPLIGDAVIGSGPGLMLVVEKFPNADTRAVTTAVENAMNELRPGLTGVQIDTGVYRPATYLNDALHNLGWWALVALVLVAALLGGYFLSWRAALISFVAMSVSLVAAVYALSLRGAPINMMTLAGLVVAIGVVVDESIVDVDRLRHRPADQDSDAVPATSKLAELMLATRRPMLYATLIVLLVPVPLLFLGGVAGAFSGALILSYAIAAAAAAVVSLTVTPALASVLLGRTPLPRPAGPLLRLAHNGFDRTAPPLLRSRRAVYVVIALLVVAGLGVLPQLGSLRSAGQVDGQSLLPTPQDRDLLVHWRSAPGTSLAEMTRLTTAASRVLRAIPGVLEVGAHVGRAVTADQVVDVNSAELWVRLTHTADYGATTDAIRRVATSYPGLRGELVTYQTDQVNAATADPIGPLTIRVYGTDLGQLRTTANDVRKLVTNVPGIQNPTVRALAEEPTLEVKVNLDTAQRYGIKPGDVRRTAATYFSGLAVGSIYQNQQIFDVVVEGTPTLRNAPVNLADLLIDTPDGGAVRLGDVAAVDVAPYPTAIPHDATSRYLDVTADVRGRDLGSVINDVNGRLANMQMPLEFHAEVLSSSVRQQGTDNLVIGLALAVVIGIFLLLQAAFRNWRLAAIVLSTLPLAVTGGVLTAFAIGGVGTLGALLGLATMLAVAARNALLVIDGCQRCARADGESDRDRVARATRELVGPVLCTALAVAAVALPALFFGPVAGFEVVYPWAVTVLGGLVSATVLTLFVLPALYLRVGSPAHEPSVDGSPEWEV